MAVYSQVSLQPDGRLRLSPTLIRHLPAVPGGSVWVGAHAGVVSLWSEAAWSGSLADASARLGESVASCRKVG